MALGNKKDNITVIYTPWNNLKKDGSMAVGQVGFRDQKKVRCSLSIHCRIAIPYMLRSRASDARLCAQPFCAASLRYMETNSVPSQVKKIHIPQRENPIVNRLNKTRVEKFPDLHKEKEDYLRNIRKQDTEVQRKKVSS